LSLPQIGVGFGASTLRFRCMSPVINRFGFSFGGRFNENTVSRAAHRIFTTDRRKHWGTSPFLQHSLPNRSFRPEQEDLIAFLSSSLIRRQE
jgi:hypothetical protein